MVLFAQTGGGGPWRGFLVEDREALVGGFEVIRSDHPDIPECDEPKAREMIEERYGAVERYEINIGGAPAVALVVVGEPKATEPDACQPPMFGEVPGCGEPAVLLLAVVLAVGLAAYLLFS